MQKTLELDCDAVAVQGSHWDMGLDTMWRENERRDIRFLTRLGVWEDTL